jgi:hypothetical protein
MNTPLNSLIFVLLLIAALAVVAWLMQRRRSLRLKRRFGPEYDLTVSEFRSRPRTEIELLNVERASPD